MELICARSHYGLRVDTDLGVDMDLTRPCVVILCVCCMRCSLTKGKGPTCSQRIHPCSAFSLGFGFVLWWFVSFGILCWVFLWTWWFSIKLKMKFYPCFWEVTSFHYDFVLPNRWHMWVYEVYHHVSEREMIVLFKYDIQF